MPSPSPRRLAAAAAAVLALGGALGGALGCDAGPSEPALGGDYEVRVSNVGDVELRDVAVYVSDADSVRLSALPVRTTSAYRPVAATHESPYVRATVGGRVLMLSPVEGFAGFNPKLPRGRYTVSLAAVTGEGGERRLDVRMRRD